MTTPVLKLEFEEYFYALKTKDRELTQKDKEIASMHNEISLLKKQIAELQKVQQP